MPCLLISSFKYTSHIELEPTLKTSFYLCFLFKGPIFEHSHILRYWKLELQQMNLEEGFTVQPITMSLTFVKNTGQLFCKISLNLSLSDVYSCLSSSYAFLTEVKTVTFSVHHISRYMILISLIVVILTLITWLR